MIAPTIGRIVLYCLSSTDAEAINRRRTDGQAIAVRIAEDKWPLGAQAHIGNKVSEGDVFPATIVKVWSGDCINIKVFLDGTDDYWATSRNVSETAEPGKFHWMPYQLGQAAKATQADTVTA